MHLRLQLNYWMPNCKNRLYLLKGITTWMRCSFLFFFFWYLAHSRLMQIELISISADDQIQSSSWCVLHINLCVINLPFIFLRVIIFRRIEETWQTNYTTHKKYFKERKTWRSFSRFGSVNMDKYDYIGENNKTRYIKLMLWTRKKSVNNFINCFQELSLNSNYFTRSYGESVKKNKANNNNNWNPLRFFEKKKNNIAFKQ